MNKSKILAAFSVMAIGGVAAAFAQYPVFTGYVPAGQQQPVQFGRPGQAQQPVMMPGQRVIQPGQVQQMPTTAANPTRVTGALPQVGSNATSRRYYQPGSFDRLADSGLYIGLSIAYATSVNGGLLADYRNQANAWFVPGSFRESPYKTDTVLPMQLSVGAAINSDIRVDFSYNRFSGISHPDSVQTSDGAGGFLNAAATGGAITATATMLNVYYNLDSYTGYLAGGALRPYIGVGAGISTNTIADYLIHDNNFYGEVPIGSPSIAGELTGISDIFAYHAGGTRENLAFMFEGGVTTEMEGGIKIDFFVRYTGLGKVQSSGSIVVSQTEWLGTGFGTIGDPGSEEPAPYDSVFHYTNWFESGNLGVLDLGIRLRLQF
ncbi:MAG: hypothetical protein FWE52_01795 [Alphaproteobacteria bacterium]|nr:hypothetical protein [Alphaproteobacteria bacterium]